MSVSNQLKSAIQRVVAAVRHLGLTQDPAGMLTVSGDKSELNTRLLGLAAAAVNLYGFTDKQITDFFAKIEGEDEKGVDIQFLRMSVAIQKLITWIVDQGLPDAEPRDIVHQALGLPPDDPEILKEIRRIQQRTLKALGPAAPRMKL